MQERKRTRAQPPDGWLGESRVVKKRQVNRFLSCFNNLSGYLQVGERAVKLKHILEISTNKEKSTIPNTEQVKVNPNSIYQCECKNHPEECGLLQNP